MDKTVDKPSDIEVGSRWWSTKDRRHPAVTVMERTKSGVRYQQDTCGVLTWVSRGDFLRNWEPVEATE